MGNVCVKLLENWASSSVDVIFKIYVILVEGIIPNLSGTVVWNYFDSGICSATIESR